MSRQIEPSLVAKEQEIESLIPPGSDRVREVPKILERARKGLGLELEEAATLLNVCEGRWLDEICDAARKVKEKIFGKRIVLFAPLYISNRCANNCLYCGFRRDNSEAERKTLSVPEIVHEATFLAGRGYQRILLVAGEDPSASSVDYLCEAVQAIYAHTEIRVVHLNAAPMTVQEFARLKSSGVGVYQCFQETYHRDTYERLHPSGPKRDYDWRYSVMERALEGGFDDIGMGALLGLYDYRFEVLSLIGHVRTLEQRHGVGPHTISVPRFRPAQGAVLKHAASPVSDNDFKKIVAVYRLTVPYSGVVVSTREGAELRDQVIGLGASQISAGSRTDIGGYTHPQDRESSSQFSLSDSRSLDEMIHAVMQAGHIPSLCTSCYRSGRTGETFRNMAETGRIKDFCLSNALLSLMEYLQHHAETATRVRGIEMIREALSKHPDPHLARTLEAKLEQIAQGDKDVHV